MTLLANPHFILQISHAKTFKIKYTRCPYNNIIQKYSKSQKDRLCVVHIFIHQMLLQLFDTNYLCWSRLVQEFLKIQKPDCLEINSNSPRILLPSTLLKEKIRRKVETNKEIAIWFWPQVDFFNLPEAVNPHAITFIKSTEPVLSGREFGAQTVFVWDLDSPPDRTGTAFDDEF